MTAAPDTHVAAAAARPGEAGQRPLDVVVVTVRFPSAAETFVTSRVRSLLDLGHRVRVLAFRTPEEGWTRFLRERRLEGTPVVHNGTGPTVSGVLAALARPALAARALAWLVRTCRREPVHLWRALAVLPFAFWALARLERDTPDVVHLEWGHYPSVLVPLVRWRGLPCVVSLSLVAYDIYRGFPGTRTAAALADVVRTQARGNVPEIVAATGLSADRVELVPDGVDTERIAGIARAVDKVPGRVAVVSRLVPAKGVDDALRAFAAARERHPDATLRVMGTGPEEEPLRSLAAELGVADAVTFLGHVSHDDVLRELAAADVLLHLSHMERLPNAVKEGMASGCVVITTRTIGIEELVEDGRTGYLVDVRDHAAAAAALTRALAEPAEHAAVRAAAEALVRETMDHAASVRKLVGLWRRALVARGRGETVGVGQATHADITG